MKFLYHEFGSTVLKVVPATSVGFLVFELVKREVDFRSMDFDPFHSMDQAAWTKTATAGTIGE